MASGREFPTSDFLRLQARSAEGDKPSTTATASATATAAGPATEAKAQNMIMIWLSGGPSTIDMWDLKPDAGDGIKGPFQPIDTSAEGIQISDKLPQMAQVMDRCTVIRSLAHSIPGYGPVYMNTGNKPSPALRYPSLGSLTSRLLKTPDEVPPYVAFGNDRNGGTNAGYLGPAWIPFQVQNGNGRLEVRGVTLPEDVTLDDLSGRVRLLETFDYRLSALNEVAEVVAGEFGRTPKINGNTGRDHWARSMSVVLAGGGFPGGMAYGSTSTDGTEIADNPCSPEDVSSTILAELGVGPERTLQTRTCRPMQFFRVGTSIDALLA